MLCKNCGFEGNPNLEETGPHTKATCRKCGAYIKMMSKDELNHLTHISNDGIKLIIKTTAPKSYIPIILKRVKLSIEKGYICGESTVVKPFDDRTYTYEFYYG